MDLLIMFRNAGGDPRVSRPAPRMVAQRAKPTARQNLGVFHSKLGMDEKQI